MKSEGTRQQGSEGRDAIRTWTLRNTRGAHERVKERRVADGELVGTWGER